MRCSKCGSERVVVQSEQIAVKGGTTFGSGPLRRIGRFCLILATCGLWAFMPEHIGSSKIKYKSRTIGICQNCGNTWIINTK